MDQLMSLWNNLSGMPLVRAGLILAGSVILALIVRAVFDQVIRLVSRRTQTSVDEEVAHTIRIPVVYSIVLMGIGWALLVLRPSASVQYVAFGILKTLAVILWAMAAMRIGAILLAALSRQVHRMPWIQPKTLPLFDIVWKLVVIAGSLYFAFIAWNINLTSWIASAGIVGIAVGFAAKDSLANLFAGVFILADAPYRIGDFIILDNGLRGVVTDIGIRSTRLLTRDDIEVTLPNAVIANAKIVNETSGPHQKMRVRVKVSVAYGSDVERVEEVLMNCAAGVEHVSDDPVPRVRFREFGDSGLLFELLAWIEAPIYRGRVLHALNTRVYKAFAEAGIEIPFPKQDLYIKEMPG